MTIDLTKTQALLHYMTFCTTSKKNLEIAELDFLPEKAEKSELRKFHSSSSSSSDTLTLTLNFYVVAKGEPCFNWDKTINKASMGCVKLRNGFLLHNRVNNRHRCFLLWCSSSNFFIGVVAFATAVTAIGACSSHRSFCCSRAAASGGDGHGLFGAVLAPAFGWWPAGATSCFLRCFSRHGRLQQLLQHKTKTAVLVWKAVHKAVAQFFLQLYTHKIHKQDWQDTFIELQKSSLGLDRFLELFSFVKGFRQNRCIVHYLTLYG